jgi:hypothetical protein
MWTMSAFSAAINLTPATTNPFPSSCAPKAAPPLVVEKTTGRGRVIVQAVPLNVSWSNLPLCQSFVVMVHEWLWYLTESGMVRRNLQPGEPLQVSTPLDSGNGGATVDTPGSGLAQVVGREEQGRMIFRYAKTLVPRASIASKFPARPAP